MPQLALANSFWESYDVLEKPVKSGVRKAMAKFQQLSVAELYADKGLHLESVDNARDPRMRTIRINDFWRGVVLAPDDGSDVFLLANVVPHDDAYSWAAKRLYTTNTATRGLEVRNVVAIEQLTPALEKAASTAPSLLFARYSDNVLRELGIDDQVLQAVRTVIDKQQLQAFGTLLPEDQFEALEYLAEGFSPEDVYRDVVVVRRPADVGTGSGPDDSLAAAIGNTTSRITLVTGPDELTGILEKPFAAWRVFLHPSQRRVAYRTSYGGPAQVTGGPGTGKTVVALHRVKHLLSRSQDSRVLLTTYTNALAATLRENLSLLLDGDEAQLARVDVTTVNAYAHRIVSDHDGRQPSPIGDRDERQLWQRVVRKLGLPWTEQFLAQEYRHVILAQDIRDLDNYRTTARRGRGSALSTALREQLWPAIELFTSMLRDKRATTHLRVCARAAQMLAEATPEYHHVVVDEAQDLHPAQWRVLRGAVAPGSDDLFITGDPNQRIYDSKVSLGSLGIRVTGRTSRLRINYRSTEEILAWSTGILTPTSVDDLSGEGSDSLAGYRSLLHGRTPSVKGHGTEQTEIAALVEQVQDWIKQGIRPSEIAVCARFNVLLDKAYGKLSAAGISVTRVRDTPGPEVDGVRLATMHAMKGLEFRCVTVLGMTARALPFAREITPVEVDQLQHDSDILRERCLLFVACTRAREALHVSWSGVPSEYVPRANS
ncbi:UvrD/REP helicase N-terminal domain-containing protein [Streptomyces sp. WMMB 714]|uniref:UvrD-helicase domain-containing protein n=1 Tax=Streptomyces sp. WMMB 714 TaxID=1286822 RepID=UPI0005F838B4|nr:DEAD/DEAH box helicase [Streptomyces sp. WMMB 714]SCK47870.1 UvrD/REP helicase N-terminal domain-containing protein [Streptomyces sp. WMMB 714]